MKKVVLVFLFYLMVLTAVLDSLRGLFMPLFKSKFSLNDIELSLIISVSYAGFLFFTFVGSRLMASLRNKIFIFIVLNMGALAFLFLSFINIYYVILFFIFLQCGVSSMLSLFLNGNVPIMYPNNAENMLSLLHFVYGAAMSLTQFFVGIIIGKGTSYGFIYFTLSIILFISSLAIFPLKFQNTEIIEDKSKKKIKISKTLILFVLSLGCYFIAEHVTLNWFITFSINSYSVDYDYAANLIAIFFTLFTIGRLLGGVLMNKFTKEKVVLIFLMCAFILYTIGILIKVNGLILISISGFFFSIVLTIIFLLLKDYFKSSYAKVLSVVFICADLIDILANFTLGFLNGTIGYRLTFFMIPIALLVCFICIYILVKNKKNNLIKEDV